MVGQVWVPDQGAQSSNQAVYDPFGCTYCDAPRFQSRLNVLGSCNHMFRLGEFNELTVFHVVIFSSLEFEGAVNSLHLSFNPRKFTSKVCYCFETEVKLHCFKSIQGDIDAHSWAL